MKSDEPLEAHGLFPTTAATTAEQHIAELREWLVAHPNPSTYEGKRAKHDRQLALSRWLHLTDTERTAR